VTVNQCAESRLSRFLSGKEKRHDLMIRLPNHGAPIEEIFNLVHG
jgi:hypothetical protein